MDPWDIAAQKHTAQIQQEEITARAAREQAELKEAAQQATERAACQTMQAAISAAAVDLARFMRARGAAAIHLLDTKERHVLFGSHESGGGYSSVYIDGTGIGHEVGHRVGYGSEPSENEPSTASEAVYYFAYFGEGRGNPQAVCGIVEWLKQQIDSIAKS